MHIEVFSIFYLLRSGLHLASCLCLLELLSPSVPELLLIQQFIILDSCLLTIDNGISFLLKFLVDLAESPFKCFGVKVLIAFLQQFPEAFAHFLFF